MNFMINLTTNELTLQPHTLWEREAVSRASQTETLDFDEAASQSTTQAGQIRNLAYLATQLRIASVRWENMSSCAY